MTTPPSFIDELTWRGLLHQTTSPDLADHLKQPRIAYCGFDPTADSLTIGNFLAIKLLMHWQRCGHTPLVLIGGGTGLVGDPSGRDEERALLSNETIAENLAGQRKVLETLLDFSPGLNNAARIVNNADWLSELHFLPMLRDIGKHFSINRMLERDSVRDRLKQREQGISYTEFSYMLLQAYDFLHLYRTQNCTVQVAGSDQYGNIVSGIDLIHRLTDGNAYGLTSPLITHADGRKIGKSSGATLWLSAERTSPYRFHQYWLNCADDEVIDFLKRFTFLPADEIQTLANEHETAPHQRPAQRALARCMTTLVHGETACEAAEAASTVLFGGGDVRALDAETLRELCADLTATELPATDLGQPGAQLTQVLVKSGLAPSLSRAREFLKNGAVALNGERITEDRPLTREDLLHNATTLLRRGRKNWAAVHWK